MSLGQFLVVLLVLALVAGVGTFVVTSGFTPSLFLMGAVIVYVALTSVYLLPADKMLASFFLGTHTVVYLSGTIANRKDVHGTRYIHYVDEDGNGVAYRGLFGLDFVILLYPFWRARLFGTTENVGIVHASRSYTRHVPPSSPEVPALVDVTITFELSPDLKPFIRTFPVLSGPYDLSAESVIHDNMWDPTDPNRQRHEYTGTVLAMIVMNVINNDIVHRVRTVAAEYQWLNAPRDTGKNIKGDKTLFEKQLRRLLCDRNAAIVRGGLLQLLVDEDGHRHGEPGRSAASFDIIIEDVTVEDEEARKALARPLIAAMEAQADATRGSGRGRYYANLAKKSKIPAHDAIVLETIDKSQGDLNIFTAGESIVQLVAGLAGRLKRKKKPPT